MSMPELLCILLCLFIGHGDHTSEASTPGHQALLLHVMSLCMCWEGKNQADHDLTLARVLTGPTVEQQGEMARSGGRTLATLEPEQVVTSADESFVSFQSESCCTVCTTVKPADPSVFLLCTEFSEL